MAPKQGKVRESEARQEAPAPDGWGPDAQRPADAGVPRLRPALMAKEREKAKKHVKQDMAENRADALKLGMNVTYQDWMHWRLRWTRYKHYTRLTDSLNHF